MKCLIAISSCETVIAGTYVDSILWYIYHWEHVIFKYLN